MAVDRAISINIVKKELKDCEEDEQRFGWQIFGINEDSMTFAVKMVSSVDGEIYLIYAQFDDYAEIPLLIEFVDPLNGQMGTKNAYPLGNDSFFNTAALICHPCSRKAYKQYNGPHSDWGDLIGWQRNPQTGALKNIPGILRAISERINDRGLYKGRMK